MNSFAFWCRRRADSSSENIPISATVNVNLWVDRIHERQAATQTYLDFGLMLSRGEEKGKSGQKGKKKTQPNAASGQTTIDAPARNGTPLIEQVGGIALYCPFRVQEDRCRDLKPFLNKDTLGAIFNDRCKVSELDYNGRYLEVELANDKDYFYLLSCGGLNIRHEDDGSIVQIDFPMPKEIREKAERVYVRFRLAIDDKATLIVGNDSRDKVLTSALSREETIDFRLNDYRTLSDNIRERIDGEAEDVCRLTSVTIHTLLMAHSSVDVDSFEELHDTRLLEGGDTWKVYAPNGEPRGIVAWHWKKRLEKPSDGYKLYLKLKIHVCNWGTIVLYLLFLTSFSIFINLAGSALCDWVGMVTASALSGAASALLLIYGFSRSRNS